MHSIETGIFLGRIPYTKVGSGLNPILVINGGQGFMMMPDTARISKDARRLTSVLPQGRSFILLGYDPDAVKVTVDGLAADVSNIIDQHLGGTADVVGLSYVRIPLKPATDSETKPAICSDFIPASIPI